MKKYFSFAGILLSLLSFHASADSNVEFYVGQSDYGLKGGDYADSFKKSISFKAVYIKEFSDSFFGEVFLQANDESKGSTVITPEETNSEDPGRYFDVSGAINTTSIGVGVGDSFYKTKYFQVDGRLGINLWYLTLDESVFSVRSNGDSFPISGVVIINNERFNASESKVGISPYASASASVSLSEHRKIGVSFSITQVEVGDESVNLASGLLFLKYTF
ncbi:MAG: hypothetical protein K6L80_00630 [Agarilytica sp.]